MRERASRKGVEPITVREIVETEKRERQEFFELAARFRDAEDPEDVKRLGDQMGQMVFGE